MDISIIIPLLNEEENVKLLYCSIKKTMERLGRDYELLFVDDGSTDNTFSIISDISKRDNHLKVIKFRRRFGQTTAISAGIDNSRGRYIVLMDGDLQNDPSDIPGLVEEIEKGYDVVTGWRKKRKDTLFIRKIPSLMGNLFLRLSTSINIHDTGCGLKIIRKECFKNMKLYNEMHRYLPILLGLNGYKVVEFEVNHHPRLYGKSKYSINRMLKVIYDTITFVFLWRFKDRPFHFLGMSGLFTIFSGFIFGFYLTWIKIFMGEGIGGRPLLFLSILLILSGIQLVITGLIGELIIRVRKHNKFQNNE